MKIMYVNFIFKTAVLAENHVTIKEIDKKKIVLTESHVTIKEINQNIK